MFELIKSTPRGLYCEPGAFYIDPLLPVPRAVLTHAHADCTRPGSDAYLGASEGAAILRTRLGAHARIETQPWGVETDVNGVRISFHPSGHIRGAAQIRLNFHGDVWCISGHYKLEGDPTCTSFEPLECRVFVTESTFGLPVFRWPSLESEIASINHFWEDNANQQRPTVLFCHSPGKAQRLLATLDSTIGPFYCNESIDRVNQAYTETGFLLPKCLVATAVDHRRHFTRALILAPPSAQGDDWLRRLGNYSTAFVSGSMRIRGQRRQQKVDRGFILSDHADWGDLNTAIDNTAAEQVLVTGGIAEPMMRWLNHRGVKAGLLAPRPVVEDRQ